MAGMVVVGVQVKVGTVDLSDLVTGLPDLSRGEPERVEATGLNDTMRVYVNGIRDIGDSLALECKYSLTEYQSLLALEEANRADNKILIKFTQDNLAFEFDASVSVTYGATEVGGLRKMTVNLTPATEITVGVKEEELSVMSAKKNQVKE
ncbi:hypothetical protein [Turicibacter sanguinis]|uniref:hypothetical protein n=1 Tax=Turicibacter sanguinis TaxID=154288 RepID=UPI0018AB4572|nr:hypothetical protein [Turicibacter sanguinis]MDB8553879.1 hypothetical protein [Turicibacter sanguinis]